MAKSERHNGFMGLLKVKARKVTFPITVEISWECPNCNARTTDYYPLRDMFDNHSKIKAQCFHCDKYVVVRLTGISTELKREKKSEKVKSARR